MRVQSGAVSMVQGSLAAELRLSYWQNCAWHPMDLRKMDDRLEAGHNGVSVSLMLSPVASGCHCYTVALTSSFPTRIRLALEVPLAHADPFHIIPACLLGDNNLRGAEPGHFPNLTREAAESVSCSPYWEFRADRAALPLSMLLFQGGVAALSIQPYTQAGLQLTTSREGFIRNGVCAMLGDGGGVPHACGVTIGYRNTPVSFVNKDQWGVPTEHLVVEAEASGFIHLHEGTDRLVAHSVIRQVYDALHERPQVPITSEAGIRFLTRAFLDVNWQEDREHFTNLWCKDAGKCSLTPWRTLAEVGWTGGGVIAHPLLMAGVLYSDDMAVKRAVYLLDWMAKAYNPASGLLWDVCGKNEGVGVNGWWSGYLVKDVHCAYTNASGVYYLLKSYEFLLEHQRDSNRKWLHTACQVLDTMLTLQFADGRYGFTYSTTEPRIVDADGFAGVYWAAAMAIAARITGNRRYTDSARRAMEFYRESVRSLCCCGTPMDTWKSPDQEGNLGFMRAAAELFRTTRNEDWLTLLEEGAYYEYIWRYGFRSRPEFRPLKGSHWSSVGGSVTSVSNPHIHPMGVFVSRELDLLATHSGSAYHRQRRQDGLDWALNSISLYPTVTGYGQPGVMTERFCPSDGLTIETLPDGSPSSMWFSYNGWAAAAVLEGLVASAW
jgi:hypothetical protein